MVYFIRWNKLQIIHLLIWGRGKKISGFTILIEEML